MVDRLKAVVELVDTPSGHQLLLLLLWFTLPLIGGQVPEIDKYRGEIFGALLYSFRARASGQ